MKSVLVTGSAGLVGSECVRHFAALGYHVHGLDSGARRDFFGEGGDTSANLARLRSDLPDYAHHQIDVRERERVAWLVGALRPSLIIHAAAQPSHDLAALRPFDDFEVNALGTLNLLAAARRYCPESPFCFLSTNKVYGDAPNELSLVEQPMRYDYALPADRLGISESMRTDQTTHSLFGCSKLAADALVQEHGRAFGMPTVCFRAGCLTGGAHAGVERHGFLAYLVRCCREGRPYRIYGHGGKQVRDQLHAADVARACEVYAASPRPGEVYNLGGGRANSISVLEAIDAAEQALGRRLSHTSGPARLGDHVVYYSDTSKFRSHYPDWKVTRSLSSILEELCGGPAHGAAR